MTETKPKHIISDATINRHINKIDEAAKRAAKLLIETAATSAAAAAKLISDAAAIALDVTKTKDGTDHDILIEVRKGLEFVVKEMEKLTNGLEKRLSDIELSKADQKDLDELKKEVEKNKECIGILKNKVSNNRIYMALYSLLILGLTSLIITHLFNNHILK